MTKKKASGKEKKPKEKDKHDKDSNQENDAPSRLGVLPDRDLKKNLGCG